MFHRMRRKNMAHSQTRHHSFRFGLLPNRWRFAANCLLTGLVLMAALVQALPDGMASTQATAAISISDASVGESLTCNAHAVESWMAQPTAATRLTVSRPNDAKPLQFAGTTCDRVLVCHIGMLRCKRQCAVDSDSCCAATLLELNVRLQI